MNFLKNILFSLIPFLFILLFYSCAPPSNFKEHPYQQYDSKKEKFNVDPLVFYETDSSKARLDLYIEIPSENITFKKDIGKEKYESKITISIGLFNSGNEQIFTNTYNKSLEFNDEEMKKVSKESQYFSYNYIVEPGNNKLEIKINDSNSKNEFKKSLDVYVKDFKSQEITLSDLMILSKYKINDSGEKEITPLINNNIFGLKEFFVFFEIYNKNDADILKEYVYKLKDNKDVVIKEDVFTYNISPGKNRKVENIFVMKELKKYLPEEPDFDFFLYDNEQNIFFKLEIIDKSNNEIVASKNLTFIPKRIIRDMQKEGPMR